ncbi:MAG TPA: hypothetical protein VNT51_00380 [Miltoncostaeaceae bacterium]|nr:hypothetical protein [Miltoncostaeaceae bacterium]
MSGLRRRGRGAVGRELATWGAALTAAAVATLVASAGGARLGAALTAGVAALLVVVVGVTGWRARPGAPVPPRRPRTSPTPSADRGGKPGPRQ